MMIRPGTDADVTAVLRLLDMATAWLSSQGRTGQWGTQAQSTDPRRIAQVQGYVTHDGLWIAADADAVTGALAVGAAGSGIPPVEEPELFIRLLVTDRTRGGSGIGTALLDHARRLALSAGAGLLRVDCYAGDDQKLVRYYEGQGFTRTTTFRRGDWPGQVLEQRLASRASFSALPMP
ncbi:GNAT family N-acetyltransferase [Actinoplanes sp. TFC3]|uniref:GNAT family N-acetyltransferase n=1 Tax=Actinoplanes sp. TFC3 TaxID=1710355 RepID=UPI00082B68A9|nr:GNAT family N-acetyltransferase [Actinoplanes sp. TFC3]